MQEKIPLLVLLGGGGFYQETCFLLRQLGDGFDLTLIYPKGSLKPENPPLGKLVTMREFSGRGKSGFKGKFLDILSLIPMIRDGINLIRATNPAGVICIASSISIPLLIAAKITKKDGYFIESITRVDNLSITSRIVRLLNISTFFYVQWPELAKKYPGTIYSGSVIST